MNLHGLIDALDPPLSEHELAEFQRLMIAIHHSLDVAAAMPTTLDGRVRALVITKLQEAEHWSLELLRVPRPKGSPTQ